MIGMGPYVLQEDTPIGEIWLKENQNVDKKLYNKELFTLSLKMIAISRIFLGNVNIAATTALQAINPVGREVALNSGSNMVMPIITPTKYRVDYQLYQGKPCIDDTKEECKSCLSKRIYVYGKDLSLNNDWGDPLHYFEKINESKIEKF
jgi:biotin synthase